MKKLHFIALCLFPILTQAQVYNFPVKPGTEAWNKLETETERLSALQIPDNILKTMSTQDLITTCMNYPAMGYYTAYNNPQEGMDVIIQNFNGLQELMNRSDAPNLLLATYKQMNNKFMSSQAKLTNQASGSIKKNYFEWLINQDAILNKMNEDDRSTLLEEVRNKIFYQIDQNEEYSSLDFHPSLLLLSKLKERSSNSSSISSVNESIDQLLVKAVSATSLASQADAVYTNYTIQTPKGTSVNALKLVSGELTSSEKNELKNYWLDYYNNRITFAGEATYEYNCHAYAWYCSEGYSYVWINTPGDDAFWNDGSFVLTTTPDENSKVSFASDDHSAIMTSQSGYLKSKWGASPLFIHTKNDCPYNSSTLRYYRYADPEYDTTPSKPTVVTFRKESDGSFSASVSNDSRFNVDQYEWKTDYAGDWSIIPQNTDKSSVKVYRTSNSRSCNLSARGHNNYGWGEWQVVGWVYTSQTYSLIVRQNPVSNTLSLQIQPASDADVQNMSSNKKTVTLSSQAYAVGLYSNRGTCVYQSNVSGDGSGMINVNIDVSSLSNGIYILHVAKTGTNEAPITRNIVVKH